MSVHQRGVGPPKSEAARRSGGTDPRPRASIRDRNSNEIIVGETLDNHVVVACNAPVRQLRAENLAVLRRQHLCREVWARGPRLIHEFVEEVRRNHPEVAADIDRRLERYAGLDPALIAALGADRLSVGPMHLVEAPR